MPWGAKCAPFWQGRSWQSASLGLPPALPHLADGSRRSDCLSWLAFFCPGVRGGDCEPFAARRPPPRGFLFARPAPAPRWSLLPTVGRFPSRVVAGQVGLLVDTRLLLSYLRLTNREHDLAFRNRLPTFPINVCPLLGVPSVPSGFSREEGQRCVSSH